MKRVLRQPEKRATETKSHQPTIMAPPILAQVPTSRGQIKRRKAENTSKASDIRKQIVKRIASPPAETRSRVADRKSSVSGIAMFRGTSLWEGLFQPCRVLLR